MTSRILVSVNVAASPERAFAVFTTQIGSWWRPDPLFAFTRGTAGILEFEPREGGALTETYDDGTSFEIGRITAWEPTARLAFTWRQADFGPGQVTHVEVTFEPVGSHTRVTVRHWGWDTVPQHHAARHGMRDGIFLHRHGEWWQRLLSSLDASLT